MRTVIVMMAVFVASSVGAAAADRADAALVFSLDGVEGGVVHLRGESGHWTRTSYGGGAFLVSDKGVETFPGNNGSPAPGVVLELKSADKVHVTCRARSCSVGTRHGAQVTDQVLQRGAAIELPAAVGTTFVSID